MHAASTGLADGIAVLDRALKTEVDAHYDELLAQLGGIGEADRILEIVRAGVHSLQETMGRVRDEIVEPHRMVSSKTRQLENLTKTVDTLHRIIRMLKLVARLKETLHAASGGGAKQAGGAGAGGGTHAGAATGDLAKAAKMLADIKELEREGGAGWTDGVEVIDRDARWLAGAGRDIRAAAGAALKAGMEAASQAEVGAALQVYHNLGELNAAVDAQVSALAAAAVDHVREALDPARLAAAMGGGRGAGGGGGGGGITSGGGVGRPGGAVSRSGMPPSGQEHRWAEALWQRMGAAFEQVAAAGMSVWHLQRVLAKKRDPISHALFLDEVTRASSAGGATKQARAPPCERFVAAFSKGTGEVLQRSHAAAGFARDTLLVGFPRLVTLIQGLHERLAKDSDAASKGVPPAVRKDGADLGVLMKASDAVSNAFLARSFQRLSEPVNALLSPSALQSLQGMVGSGGGGVGAGTVGTRQAAEDVRRFLLRVREELDAVAAHPALVTQVTGGVAKALRLMAQKAEYGTVGGPEARQLALGQPSTSAQRANASLAAALEEVCAALGAVAPMLPPTPRSLLEQALAQVAEVAAEAMAPVIQSASEACEAQILLMHKVDWAGDAALGEEGETCSQYMAGLVDILRHLREEHLSKVQVHRGGAAVSQGTNGAKGLRPAGVSTTGAGRVPSAIAAAKLASRCLDFFVRHVALVRRLSENGKLRLTMDMAELERAVAVHLHPVEALGAPYRALRALRPFLFLASDDVLESPLLGDLPRSCVLHHLYSHAPKELATPYQRAGLAPPQYSTWMDKHTEQDVWAGIKGTLEAYAAACKAKGKALDPVHGIMMEVGRAVEDETSEE